MSGSKDWLFGDGGLDAIRAKKESAAKNDPFPTPIPPPPKTPADITLTKNQASFPQPSRDELAVSELDPTAKKKKTSDTIEVEVVKDEEEIPQPKKKDSLLDIDAFVPKPYETSATLKPIQKNLLDTDDEIPVEEEPPKKPLPSNDSSSELPALSPQEAASMLEIRPARKRREKTAAIAKLTMSDLSPSESEPPPPPEAPSESPSELFESSEALSPVEAANLIESRQVPTNLLKDEEPPENSDESGRLAVQETTQSVRETLETNSEQITLRRLAKRGVKNVRVMDMAQLNVIMTQAVEQCLEKHHIQISAAEREQLEREAKREFVELLAEHRKVVAEKSEVEKKRDELFEQVSALQDEMKNQMLKLDAEHKRHAKVAGLTEFSAVSFEQMTDHINNLFKTLINDETRKILVEHGPAGLPKLKELEAEISSVLQGVIDEERKKTIDAQQQEHQQRVQILETRIRKLNSALSTTEDALQKVAAMKNIETGVASIYQTIQGLSTDDANYGRKAELLKTIFLENLELQGLEIEEEDTQGVVTDEDPDRVETAIDPNAPLAMPAGFSAPIDLGDLTSESAF